jgi:hypothetical protein
MPTPSYSVGTHSGVVGKGSAEVINGPPHSTLRLRDYLHATGLITHEPFSSESNGQR